MKKCFKWWLATGILLTALLIPAVGIFANPVTRSIEASFRNIRIFMDGRELVPRDGTGNVVEPFIYNGTTYLPVRAIGEAFDREVNWDAANAHIHLNTPNRAGITQPRLAGTNFNMIDLLPRADWSFQNLDGTIYPAIEFLGRPRVTEEMWTTIEINGEFRRFEGELGRGRSGNIGNQSATGGASFNDSSAIFRITGDGRELGTFTVSGGFETTPVNIDVTGVNTLRIDATLTPQSQSTFAQRMSLGGYFYP